MKRHTVFGLEVSVDAIKDIESDREIMEEDRALLLQATEDALSKMSHAEIVDLVARLTQNHARVSFHLFAAKALVVRLLANGPLRVDPYQDTKSHWYYVDAEEHDNGEWALVHLREVSEREYRNGEGLIRD